MGDDAALLEAIADADSEEDVSSVDAADAIAADGPPVPVLSPDFAWYRLDETSGTTAHDSTSHHYDMTNLSGVVWGAGATFDGTSVCGSTTVGQAFRTPPVTMTVWLEASSRGDETASLSALLPFPPNAFSGDAPDLGGFGVGLNVWTDGAPGSEFAIETGVNQATSFHHFTGYSSGTKYFAALVIRTDGLADFYVDGLWKGTFTANTPSSTAPAPLHLGCHNDDTVYATKRFFKGRIRDARIYTRTLTATEVAQLFTSGPV